MMKMMVNKEKLKTSILAAVVYFSYLLLFSFSSVVFAKGTLSDNIIIESSKLAYRVQFRVYTPDTSHVVSVVSQENQPSISQPVENLPTIYITDGPIYLGPGKMVELLDREIESGRIRPVVAVFVDSRNPDDLSENRRNEQYMCNHNFADFFANELVPYISGAYPTSNRREDRMIAGLSFGGLNAACFGLMLPNIFGGIAMNSPANSELLKLIAKQYKKNELLPLKIFFSIGTKKDNTWAARKFYHVLQDKGYQVNYIEVPYGHNWENWGPLRDDLLETFFSESP